MFVLNLLIIASVLYVAALLLLNVASNIKIKELSEKKPTRSMTRDEISAVQPFIRGWMPKRFALQLRSTDVYVIVGKYTERHISHRGSRGIARYLAGLQIILPFDASNFMTGTIEAEVAVVRGFVVLISTNNGFNIVQSAKRFLEAQIPKNEIPVGKTDGVEFQELASIEEISSRKENLTEVRHFRTWDRIWYIPVFFLPTIYLANSVHGLFSWFDTPLKLLVSGALTGILLIYYSSWRWVQPKEMVREFKGRLFEIPVLAPTGSVASPILYLGTEIALRLPKHWQNLARKLIGTEVQLGLSTRANQVVSINNICSLESEERILPSQPWGGHVAPLLIGLIIFSGNIDQLSHRLNLWSAFFLVWSMTMVAIALPRLIRSYRATAERSRKLTDFYLPA